MKAGALAAVAAEAGLLVLERFFDLIADVTLVLPKGARALAESCHRGRQAVVRWRRGMNLLLQMPALVVGVTFVVSMLMFVLAWFTAFPLLGIFWLLGWV